jgi:hypothetical protein
MLQPESQIHERDHNRRKHVIKIALALALIAIFLAVWKLYSFSTTSEKLILNNAVAKQAIPSANTSTKENQNTASPEAGSISLVSSEGVNSARHIKLHEDSTLEVCGLPSSEAAAFLITNGMANKSTATRAIANAASEFSQSNDLHKKVLGSFMTIIQSNVAAMEAERLNTPGCKMDEPCFSKQFEAQRLASAVNAAPLAKLALDSNDASVYAAALYACGSAKTGACTSISYMRWAEIEPDNAAAWFMAAGEAEAKKDDLSRSIALQRAANAKSYDRRIPSLSLIFESPLVQAQSPLVQSAVAVELNNFDINTGGGYLTSGVLSHCYRPDSMDAVTRATCDVLASKLVEKDKTLLGVQIPLMIGKKIGWDAERLKLLNEEMEAATEKILQEMNESNRFTCDKLAKSTKAVRRSLATGQRAAAIEFADKSGKNPPGVSAEYRKTTGL